MLRKIQADYDSPWKEIISQFFEPCLAFFFPEIHAAIDWNCGYTFLDKELQKLTPDAESGRHTVDKLAKVQLLGGQELWLLLHIEVQGQRDKGFAERMMIYHYRIFDRHRQQLVSLAILSDNNRHWRPDHYEREAFGCRHRLDFPIVKLLDYRERISELEQHPNPFALVVLAHLRAQESHPTSTPRKMAKLQLLRILLRRGYLRKEINQLLRFIDWVLTLPEEEEQEVRQVLESEDVQMKKYVTSWERMAKEEGKLEGKLEGQLESLRATICEIIELRFGMVPDHLREFVNRQSDPDQLRALQRQAVICPSLDDLTGQLSIAE
jgi:hypothetical protein